MQSKTSFFNGTVFKKNMARFAPLWLLYTLCLLLGMAMMYVSDDGNFWFASNMGELIQYSSLINLVYGPMAAILLFGDLYNSRMCNALHAMPMKRSCWFGTNVITGITFSLLPTAIFCGLSVPLLMNTCVVNAWQIALWTFLGMNLTYLCFFGIALFSVFCTGNRFAMIAIYALLNGGAFVVWFLINSIYTPMLYGVVTPTALVQNLTPIANLMEAACVELDPYWDLMNMYAGREAEMVANYHLLPEGWLTVAIWAAVGTAFTVLAGWMYGKRKLECAGDTMATKALEPVFQVCISVCAAGFFSIFVELFFGGQFLEATQYLFLGSGLVVGWFAGRMLIERTVRVFRFKNWLGLAALAAVLAGSLAMTHYDVFGIETWMPKVEDVKSVTFGYSSYRGMSEELTEDEDIAAVIRLQELALEDRLEQIGSYVLLDGERVPAYELEKGGRSDANYVYSTIIYIYYEMENGRQVSREYIIWGDGEEGEIVNEYLSRWEVIHDARFNQENVRTAIGEIEGDGPVLDISIWGHALPEEYCTEADLGALMEAVKADCEDRTMTQRDAFHTGHFQRTLEDGSTQYTRSFWIDIYTRDGNSGDFYVFADSENVLKWLEERDLLNFTVHVENGYSG